MSFNQGCELELELEELGNFGRTRTRTRTRKIKISELELELELEKVCDVWVHLMSKFDYNISQRWCQIIICYPFLFCLIID